MSKAAAHEIEEPEEDWCRVSGYMRPAEKQEWDATREQTRINSNLRHLSNGELMLRLLKDSAPNGKKKTIANKKPKKKKRVPPAPE